MADDKKEAEISLKVVIDREKKKVVFAEAGSDFVDTLFSFLTLPMGTIVRLLANRSDPPVKIGSFTNLYASVENLDGGYFETMEWKDMLLNPRNSAQARCQNLKIDIDDTKPIQYFICETPCFYTYRYKNPFLSTYSTVKCKNCGKFLKNAVKLDGMKNESTGGVFVAETSSFVISDDLNVIPNNPASTLVILESSGIKDFAVLEENTLQLGSNEILDLLKCSFLSKTPLSDIYFSKCTNLPVPVIHSQIGTEGIDTEKMKVKVFVQKSTNKILLAHSSEDFIDFLFSLLTIPVGKVISLCNKDDESLLSIENIYQSVAELNVCEYLKSQELKDMLLNPKLSMHHLFSKHIFPLTEETPPIITWNGAYVPPGGYNYYLESPKDIYSDSIKQMPRQLTFQSPKDEGRFIRGPTKFMVTDDLVVTLLSSMSCFSYFHRLKVAPCDIEEQVINIGMGEALNLLWASLTSGSVLTNGLQFLISKNQNQKTSPNKPKSERLLKKAKVEK